MVWHRLVSGIVVFCGGCIFMANYIHENGINDDYNAQYWKMPAALVASLVLIIKMTEKDKK